MHSVSAAHDGGAGAQTIGYVLAETTGLKFGEG
jgi:hypothetical protein